MSGPEVFVAKPEAQPYTVLNCITPDIKRFSIVSHGLWLTPDIQDDGKLILSPNTTYEQEEGQGGGEELKGSSSDDQVWYHEIQGRQSTHFPARCTMQYLNDKLANSVFLAVQLRPFGNLNMTFSGGSYAPFSHKIFSFQPYKPAVCQRRQFLVLLTFPEMLGCNYNPGHKPIVHTSSSWFYFDGAKLYRLAGGSMGPTASGRNRLTFVGGLEMEQDSLDASKCFLRRTASSHWCEGAPITTHHDKQDVFHTVLKVGTTAAPYYHNRVRNRPKYQESTSALSTSVISDDTISTSIYIAIAAFGLFGIPMLAALRTRTA